MSDIKIVLTLDDKDYTVRLKNAGQDLQTFRQVVDTTGASVQRMERHMTSLGTMFRHAVQFFGAARFALLDFYNVFLQLPQHILKTSGELERLTKLMEGLSNATDTATRKAEALSNTKFIISTSLNAPFDIKALADSFVKFKAAGLEPLDGSFKGLIDSVARFGGTSETLHRASVAIQQMAGKGVISMEELRQQLGEAVPTAMRMMADSMGISMSKLVEHVSKGQVLSDGALKRLALVMQARNAGAAQEMMNTWVGAMNQLKTNFSLFEQEVANSGFMDAMKNAIQGLNSALGSEAGRNAARELGQSLGSIVVFTVDVVKNLYEIRDALTAIGIAIASTWGATKLFAIFGGAIAAVQSWKAAVVLAHAESTAAQVRYQGVVTTSNAVIAADRTRLAAVEAGIVQAQQMQAQMGAVLTTRRIALLEAERIQLVNNIATQHALMVAETEAAAKKGMGALAIGRLLGPLGLLATALTIGAFAWDQWGNSAANALAKASKTAAEGGGTQVEFNTFANAIVDANKKLASAKGELDAYIALGPQYAQVNKPRMDQLRAEIAKQTTIIQESYTSQRLTLRTMNDSAAREALSALAKSNDEQLGQISKAGEAKINAINEAAKKEIAAAGSNSKKVEEINKRAAESRSKIDKEIIANQAGNISTRLQNAKAALDAVQMDEHATAAQISAARAQYEGLIKLDNEYSAKTREANRLLGVPELGGGKDKKGRKDTEPKNPLWEAIIKEQGELGKARILLDNIQHEAFTYADQRRAIAADILAEVAAGNYDRTDEKGKKHTPRLDSPEVQELINLKTQRAELKAALAAGKSIYKDKKDLDTELSESADRLNANVPKQASNLKSLASSYAALGATLTAENKQLLDFDNKVKENLTAQAKINVIEFTQALREQNEELRVGNIIIESDQKEAAYANAIRKSREELEGKIRDIIRYRGEEARTSKEVIALQAEANRKQELMAEQHRLNMRTPLEKMVDDWKDSTKVMNDATAKWAGDTIDAIVDMAATGKIEFSSLVTSILKDILRMTLRQQLGDGMKDIFGQLGEWLKRNVLPGGAGPTVDPVDDLAVSGARVAERVAVEGSTNAFEKLTGGVSDTISGIVRWITNMFTLDTTSSATTGALATVANAAAAAATALQSVAASSGFGGGGSINVGGGIIDVIDELFANGGIMTGQGALSLRKYASGGIANSPQFAMFGEGSMAEAYVPLPDGRSIPVRMEGSTPNVTVNVINQTGGKVNAEQSQPRFDGKQLILDVVLTAAASPGPFRDNMKAAMG